MGYLLDTSYDALATVCQIASSSYAVSIPLHIRSCVIYCDSKAGLFAIENSYSLPSLVTNVFIWIIVCHIQGHIVQCVHEVVKSVPLRPALCCPFPYIVLFLLIQYTTIQDVWQENGRLRNDTKIIFYTLHVFSHICI